MNLTKPSSIVAAFDFDNTFIDRDSLLSFLIYSQGTLKTLYILLFLIPQAIKYVCGQISRQQMKETILTAFLSGKSFDSVEIQGKKFADTILDRYINPDALKKLLWHQSEGHRCLLVSASPDFYLLPWGLRHGFEKVLASKLEANFQGIVTGKLIGENCWGPQKLYRLIEYLGPKENFQLYAYGDSRGDKEMLELADYPFYKTFEA